MTIKGPQAEKWLSRHLRDSESLLENTGYVLTMLNNLIYSYVIY